MNAIIPTEDKQPRRQLIEVVDAVPVLDTSRFEHMQRIANVMAQSTLIPESLYKEKDKELPLTQIISNCFLVVNQAVRWGLDPFAVAQSVSVVRGKLCYEGKLVAAVLDAKLGVRLHHHFTGDLTKPEYRIYISDQPWTDDMIAAIKPGMTYQGARIVDGSVADWTTGDKSPWAAPKNYRRMLVYRGSRDWARFYEPAVLLGVYTPDELLDLAESARASRSREVLPSVMQRLQARQEASPEREGFDPAHVTRETAALSGEAGSEPETTDQQSVDDSSVDGGSGEAASSPPTAADPPVEAGMEAGDIGADHPDTAAPASDLITRGKLEECRDKFLRIAADATINDDDRRKTAKVALDAWRGELPDHRSFVEACLEALGRIVKSGKPETAKDERAYLDGLIARAA